MSYKKGMLKAKFKQTMRMFWTERWKYERSVEEWVDSLSGPEVIWSTPTGNVSVHTPHYVSVPLGYRAKDLLFSAIDKLVLERKLLKQQGESLKKMIESPDPENALVAVTIMATLKPRKFKKIINQEIKNTETNG